MIGVGALGGGVGSSIGGGSFLGGFSQGLAVGAFNHAMHKGGADPPRKLVFDGKRIYVIVDGKAVASYPAVSGRPLADGSFDYSADRQRIHDVGPLPEGEYSVNMNETQKWSDLGFVQKTGAIIDMGRFPGGTIAWGAERVDVSHLARNPFDVRQRSGFTIHGGSKAGSAGCIDLTTNDKAFFARVRNTGTWKLTVKY